MYYQRDIEIQISASKGDCVQQRNLHAQPPERGIIAKNRTEKMILSRFFITFVPTKIGCQFAPKNTLKTYATT